MNYDETADIYVPGNWTCLKCGFALSQQTLSASTGEVGVTVAQVMQMNGEICPNDGQPMRRTTWRERAASNQAWGESLMEDIIGAVYAEHLPGALEAIKRHYKALQSIAANSCCQPCREAALVAQHALEPPLPPSARPSSLEEPQQP